MSARDPAECTGIAIVTAAWLREEGQHVVGGCAFLAAFDRYDGQYVHPVWVPTLAGVVELVQEMRPPRVSLQCGEREDREALFAMIVPAAPDAPVH